MDPRLLALYNQELAHLREVGAEFALEFPKVARRLSMDGLEVADPYVERLLEGFAFMAARTQLKLEAEYPQFIEQMLESVAPLFLAPVPSMMVAKLHPDLGHPALARGSVVPRGSSVSSQTARGQNTRCEFRTAHEVALWPLEIVQAQVFVHAADLPIAKLPVAAQMRSGLRVRLRVHGGLAIADLPLDRLALHLSAGGDVGHRLHELFGSALGSFVWPVASGTGARTADTAESSSGLTPAALWRNAAASLATIGYDDDEALLPATLQGYSAYRLLQELAAMPQRFMFVEARALRERLARMPGREVDWVVLFPRSDSGLEARVDADSLSLFCTPAINLFPKRLDRITVDTGSHEFHAVPDRTRPMDFEVHSIESVTGFGTGPVGTQTFHPLYASHHDDDGAQPAYFTVRRAPRLLSQHQQQQGTRSGYVGSESFIALVRPDGLPYDDELRQVAANAWVTNRDLPTLLPGSASGERNQGLTAWSLDGAAAVRQVECLRGPTRPVARRPWGRHGWALINQLTLNHLSLVGIDSRQAASTLRSLLALHGPDEVGWRRQVDGIVGVHAHAVTRRLPLRGPLSFGNGVLVEVEIDELAFPDAGAHLFGSVLERFFARQAAINSFSETVLRSTTRGVIGRWAPRVGTQPLLSP